MSSSESESENFDAYENDGEMAVDDDDEDEIERLLERKRAELAELEHTSEGEESANDQGEEDEDNECAGPSPSNAVRRPESAAIMASCDRLQAGQGTQLATDEEVDVYELLERVENGEPSRVPSKKMKRVLVHRGLDHFDLLPSGWVEVTHDCGLPVYLHKQSRVATFARPYFLGRVLGLASVRNHAVPESAIPCYHAQKLRATPHEEPRLAPMSAVSGTPVKVENGEVEEMGTGDGGVPVSAQNSSLLPAPKIKLQLASEVAKTQLKADDIYAYAKNLFEFTEICVYKFRKWTDARHFGREKATKRTQPAASTPRPGLPKNVRLLTIPSAERMAKPHQRALYLTLHDGKSSISILHEYAQKVLKCIVEYGYTENRNSALPYHSVVRAKVSRKSVDTIEDLSMKEKIKHLLRASDLDTNSTAHSSDHTVVLGEADGSSKRAAKLMAAKAAVENILPGVKFDDDGLLLANGAGHSDGKREEHDHLADDSSAENDTYALFDQCGLTDTRVPDLCIKTGQPSPYITLQEILKRSAAFCDLELRPLQSRRLHHQQHLFELGAGEHTVKVVASNKRDGKQKAAQALIRRLLPDVKNWGSILRVYGQESKMRQREIRRTQDSVIKLQDEARKQNETGQGSFEPNKAILDKLRDEMMKLSRNLCDGDTTQLGHELSGGARKRRLGDDSVEETLAVRPPKLSITQAPAFDTQ